ncbi:F-box/LRR-repeat protein 4-like [Amphibalanus amphitrite]|uniref:F-box/LRR-repeat protein 4-like n=1 Tax=Amphibalanus amphitrite TaxID=1232801 RepID=UPI001C8FEEA7|nr:F-box/LRR-repeat protein 4-like [Amphibalanus amphitrite]XP_043192694.1 F-box/LRR-repeat protein 4-like [Amphibalanus amphitrite]XP_043192695.1 F-box/LRR-repeat protein 4-like [Amphibalanus amphitrite]
MPHTADPKTLEELCCKNISQNMDNLWCKHYDEHFHGKSECLYLLGPFSNLPGVLLSQLIKYLKNNGVRIGHLQLLLDYSLQDLDLSRLSKNMGTVLNTITNRCVNLRHLDLSGNAKLPLQGQLALFSTLRGLESINLSSTNTSDRVMSVIGAYCTQLQELDVQRSGVTDLGLNSLAASVPSHGTTTAGQSITKLSVEGCNLSPESAFGVIKNMPNLVHFDHPDSLWGVTQLMLQQPERAPLALTSLEGSSAAGLEVAAAACPDCTLLRLDMDPESSLEAAQQLSKLTELVLMSPCEPCPGLAELLAARGAGLTNLALNGVTGVPLAAALRHCRSLQSLILIMCRFRSEPAPGGPLSNLEHLWLAEESDGSPPMDLLRRALASPALTTLTLQNCDTITDTLLEEALDAGGLAQLETLSLEHCGQVTVEPLLRLVLQCPRLETLRMVMCPQLSRRDAGEVRRLAEGNGWRLQVEWQ